MIRLISATAAALVISLGATAAHADAGGAPAAHGTDGRGFGEAVSGAEKGPDGLASHTSGGRAGGAPAAHGTDGRGFGEAVSGAEKGPDGLAGHTSGGRAGGNTD